MSSPVKKTPEKVRFLISKTHNKSDTCKNVIIRRYNCFNLILFFAENSLYGAQAV